MMLKPHFQLAGFAAQPRNLTPLALFEPCLTTSGIVVAMLYVPCKWFAQVKARGASRWVRYI